MIAQKLKSKILVITKFMRPDQGILKKQQHPHMHMLIHKTTFNCMIDTQPCTFILLAQFARIVKDKTKECFISVWIGKGLQSGIKSKLFSRPWHSCQVYIPYQSQAPGGYACVSPVKRHHNYAMFDALLVTGNHRALSVQGCGVFNVPGDGSPSTRQPPFIA